MCDQGHCQQRCTQRICGPTIDDGLKPFTARSDFSDDNAGLNNLAAIVLQAGTMAKPASGTKRVGEDGPRQPDGLRSPGIDLPCI